MPQPSVPDVVDDLRAEQASLFEVIAGIEPDDWFRATPAWSWDVRDTIAHLADVDELAIDTCLDGPRSLARMIERCASPEDLTLAGVLRGRKHSGAEVAAWWEATQPRMRDTLQGLDPESRVPWGLGMRVGSLAIARLMECWAHGLDVHAALDVPTVDTDRLRHVAWLGTKALPYAYSVAGIAPPAAPVRVELTLPSGATWTAGPADAPDRITGPAGDYCRVFVQRLAPSESALMTTGAAAQLTLRVARSFL
jgi:uncharacterized protein (TIGR03084 family)